MSRKLCLIHANCQGDPLRKLLMLHPQFGQEFEVVKYTNYLRESIPDEQLRSCSLFLYQPLGEKWDDHASDALLARVNPDAVNLAIPNMLFKGYWPFWTNRSPIEFGDAFLDKLVGMGLEKKEILYICLHTDIAAKHDLAAMFEKSILHEIEKEKGCVVGTVDLVLERFRTEKLYNTINHPNRRLILHVTAGILSHLGYAPLPRVLVDAFQDPYPEFELPLHPQIAAFHSLSFGDAATRYNVFGKMRTYEEYVGFYVDCRQLNIRDFSSYLHLV
ncbi:WcbI family polysaccharide biosynthesis putative acetyltransferase [Desulfovibrio mangrovi]|uniref:WcbI family polysaccharide biosynthesis putative acetyltransferase n=1 Tax=Desulfovibrio mangrovi TaxID=2976983 RepID=UPI0022462CC8|nr:WcbI family polysaccharide biosynthesis putative acetyltransferase [Desulfovibrio mangrovi]UZP67174.1 WcbI family polysaccharide biosynthesis putative acetyltransferase [Desulfovibrio mangrovi]